MNLAEKLLKVRSKPCWYSAKIPWSVGENRKYLKGVEFLAVQDMFLTDTAAEADVVLPAASFIEQDGSYTACDRRVQHIRHIMEPRAGMANWKVIETLAKKFKEDFAYDSLAGITAEIETVNRLTDGIKKESFNEKGKPVFMTYDIDTAVLNPVLPALLFSEHYYKSRIKSWLTR